MNIPKILWASLLFLSLPIVVEAQLTISGRIIFHNSKNKDITIFVPGFDETSDISKDGTFQLKIPENYLRDHQDLVLSLNPGWEFISPKDGRTHFPQIIEQTKKFRSIIIHVQPQGFGNKNPNELKYFLEEYTEKVQQISLLKSAEGENQRKIDSLKIEVNNMLDSVKTLKNVLVTQSSDLDELLNKISFLQREGIHGLYDQFQNIQNKLDDYLFHLVDIKKSLSKNNLQIAFNSEGGLLDYADKVNAFNKAIIALREYIPLFMNSVEYEFQSSEYKSSIEWQLSDLRKIYYDLFQSDGKFLKGIVSSINIEINDRLQSSWNKTAPKIRMQSKALKKAEKLEQEIQEVIDDDLVSFKDALSNIEKSIQKEIEKRK